MGPLPAVVLLFRQQIAVAKSAHGAQCHILKARPSPAAFCHYLSGMP